ncbi:unnamed protein product [Soboliphyme baturini]|uniref:DDE_Tnp_1_7 domain-containing protein n=1 Tax=Soboliphyme baturini TaxID=241478 RepID=A0A183JAU2_9BILA|nr:unnamed protein product [Soboliphyme baturini]
MDFLRRVAGPTRLDMFWNSDIRKSLGLQPLLLQTEKSRLRWLGHVFQKGRRSKCSLQILTGKRPRGRPRLTWIGNVGSSVYLRDPKGVAAMEDEHEDDEEVSGCMILDSNQPVPLGDCQLAM